MAKTSWKPGNMIYPLPAVMVTCRDKGQDNIITIAWTGTICTNPPMTYISVRPERHSYEMIKNSGEFVINLTTKQLTRATDFCGVRSGRDVDKFKEARLTKEEAQEQIRLRKEYIEAFRSNLKGTLDTIKIKNPDGSIIDVKKRHEEKMKNNADEK